jgi:hypothetical protein
MKLSTLVAVAMTELPGATILHRNIGFSLLHYPRLLDYVLYLCIIVSLLLYILLFLLFIFIFLSVYCCNKQERRDSCFRSSGALVTLFLVLEHSLDDLHHALGGDLSSFVTEFLEDDFPVGGRKAIFGSNVGQDTLHRIQRDTIGLVLGSSSAQDFLLETHGSVHSVAVRVEERATVSNQDDPG